MLKVTFRSFKIYGLGKVGEREMRIYILFNNRSAVRRLRFVVIRTR